MTSIPLWRIAIGVIQDGHNSLEDTGMSFVCQSELSDEYISLEDWYYFIIAVPAASNYQAFSLV